MGQISDKYKVVKVYDKEYGYQEGVLNTQTNEVITSMNLICKLLNELQKDTEQYQSKNYTINEEDR